MKARSKEFRAALTPEQLARKKAKHKAWLAEKRKDPEYTAKVREWHRNHRAARKVPDKWVGDALVRKRIECASRGIAFDLCVEDLPLPETCPISGRELLFVKGKHPDGPSIDRIIPAKGYVRGNVRIISNYANTLRRDCLDPEMFRALMLDAEEIQRQIREGVIRGGA